jgi:hypothetical protein
MYSEGADADADARADTAANGGEATDDALAAGTTGAGGE